MKISKTINLSTFLIMLFVSIQVKISAQKTTIPNTNITFEVPENWVAQEYEGQLLIISFSEPGFILISGDMAAAGESIEDLGSKKIEEEGISLTPSQYKLIESNRASVNYTGNMEGMNVDGYAQAALSQNNEWAVLALVLCEKGQLYDVHRNAIQVISTSLNFPTTPVRTTQSSNTTTSVSNGSFNSCSNYLSGAKLYYSSREGGSVTEKNIHLCPNGYFTRNGYSETAFGGMGYSEMQLGGNGTWEVIKGNNSSFRLILHWSDGDTSGFNLEPDGNSYYFSSIEGWFILPNEARCH